MPHCDVGQELRDRLHRHRRAPDEGAIAGHEQCPWRGNLSPLRSAGTSVPSAVVSPWAPLGSQHAGLARAVEVGVQQSHGVAQVTERNAQIGVTVDLPTPPLPLAMAITFWMPAKAAGPVGAEAAAEVGASGFAEALGALAGKPAKPEPWRLELWRLSLSRMRCERHRSSSTELGAFAWTYCGSRKRPWFGFPLRAVRNAVQINHAEPKSQDRSLRRLPSVSPLCVCGIIAETRSKTRQSPPGSSFSCTFEKFRCPLTRRASLRSRPRERCSVLRGVIGQEMSTRRSCRA